MKKTLLTITCIVLGFISTAQEKLNIDIQKSELRWQGEMLLSFGEHYGTVAFKEGHFLKMGDKIVGGYFLVDMATIANEDGGYNPGLVDHLKDPDFFDVPKHPTSELKLTKVIYNSPTDLYIEANLTIKNITKRIKFYAKVDFEKEQMTTRFKIDRQRWGITYASAVKENALSDAIAFEVTIRL